MAEKTCAPSTRKHCFCPSHFPSRSIEPHISKSIVSSTPNGPFFEKVSSRLRETPTLKKPITLGCTASPQVGPQRANRPGTNEPSQLETTNSKVGVSSTRNKWFCKNVPFRLRRMPSHEMIGGCGLESPCQASEHTPRDKTGWAKKYAFRLRETTFCFKNSFLKGWHISKSSVSSTPNDH